MKSTPFALVWNTPKDSALYPLLQRFGIAARAVSSADAGCQVAHLCGVQGASAAALLLFVPDDAYPPALILHAVPPATRDALLAALRRQGVQIPLKAVVTQTNQKWPLYQLLQQLQKHHDSGE